MRRHHWRLRIPVISHRSDRPNTRLEEDDNMPCSDGSSAGLCPLTTVRTTGVATVQDLRGGSCFRGRLAALGFTPGVSVTVLQNRRSGPLLVMVRDTRIALGRGEARRIIVNPVGVD